jgi:hypothetical protein
MYLPTLPAATKDLTSLILSCEVMHVRVATLCDGDRLPALAQPTIARPTSIAATVRTKGKSTTPETAEVSAEAGGLAGRARAGAPSGLPFASRPRSSVDRAAVS